MSGGENLDDSFGDDEWADIADEVTYSNMQEQEPVPINPAPPLFERKRSENVPSPPKSNQFGVPPPPTSKASPIPPLPPRTTVSKAITQPRDDSDNENYEPPTERTKRIVSVKSAATNPQPPFAVDDLVYETTDEAVERAEKAALERKSSINRFTKSVVPLPPGYGATIISQPPSRAVERRPSAGSVNLQNSVPVTEDIYEEPDVIQSTVPPRHQTSQKFIAPSPSRTGPGFKGVPLPPKEVNICGTQPRRHVPLPPFPDPALEQGDIYEDPQETLENSTDIYLKPVKKPVATARQPKCRRPSLPQMIPRKVSSKEFEHLQDARQLSSTPPPSKLQAHAENELNSIEDVYELTDADLELADNAPPLPRARRPSLKEMQAAAEVAVDNKKLTPTSGAQAPGFHLGDSTLRKKLSNLRPTIQKESASSVNTQEPMSPPWSLKPKPPNQRIPRSQEQPRNPVQEPKPQPNTVKAKISPPTTIAINATPPSLPQTRTPSRPCSDDSSSLGSTGDRTSSSSTCSSDSAYGGGGTLTRTVPVLTSSLDASSSNSSINSQTSSTNLNSIQRSTDRSNRPTLAVNNATVQASTQNTLAGYYWYFGGIGREEATNKISALNEDGSFLVRKSERGGQDKPYTLCISYKTEIFNIQICKRPSHGKFALGNEKVDELSFGTIEELISHYTGPKSPQLELCKNDRVFGSVIFGRSPPK